MANARTCIHVNRVNALCLQGNISTLLVKATSMWSKMIMGRYKYVLYFSKSAVIWFPEWSNKGLLSLVESSLGTELQTIRISFSMVPERAVYLAIMVRSCIDASCNCRSSVCPARRRVSDVFESGGHYDDWHAHQVPHTDFLPISCISNESMNLPLLERLQDFALQHASHSLCLSFRSLQQFCKVSSRQEGQEKNHRQNVCRAK